MKVWLLLALASCADALQVICKYDGFCKRVNTCKYQHVQQNPNQRQNHHAQNFQTQYNNHGGGGGGGGGFTKCARFKKCGTWFKRPIPAQGYAGTGSTKCFFNICDLNLVVGSVELHNYFRQYLTA